jgi:hypothetical protein
MLKGQMSDNLQAGMTDMKQNLTQERAAFLKDVDLKSDQGKYLQSQFDEYERSLFQSTGDEFGRNKTFYSPEDVLKKWEGVSAYPTHVPGQGQAKGFSSWLKDAEGKLTFKGDEASWFKNAQQKVQSMTDLKPQEWQDLIKDIDVSKANTTFGNFSEGFMNTFKPANMGARLSEGAISAGISAATNAALAQEQTFEQPGMVASYMPTFIQGAEPIYGNNPYLLDPTQGMQWLTPENQAPEGQGIYGKFLRTVIPT